MESVMGAFSLGREVVFKNRLTLVDVRRVSLLAGLAALLLLASGSGGSLLASLLLLSGSLAANGGLATGGGLLLSGLRGHFECGWKSWLEKELEELKVKMDEACG